MTKTGPTRRRRRAAAYAVGLAPIVLVVALVVGIWTEALQRLATRAVVVQDDLQRADFIYVLNGKFVERARLAASLYGSGLAPLVLLARTQEIESARDGAPPRSLSERIAEEIAKKGVPDSAIALVEFPGGVVNTRDEARALRTYLENSPLRRIIVVTTDYHTGRARRTLRQELRGLEVEVRMAAAPDDSGITPWNWWTTKPGLRLYGGELAKQAAVLLGVGR